MRTMNFVRFFSKLGALDLMCKTPAPENRPQGIFRKEFFLPGSNWTADKTEGCLTTRLHRLIRRSPWIVDDISIRTKREFLSILDSEKYDFVLVRQVLNTGYIFDLPINYRKRVIVDYDDIFSDSLFAVYHGEGKTLYSKLRLQLERRILRNYEKRCLKLGAALFCSVEDKGRIVGPEGKGNAHIVPNIYENESFRKFEFGEGFGNLGSILFVGTVDYKPNREGLTWFLEEIYPSILDRFPKTKLSIVGHSLKYKEFFCNIPGVQFHPNVPDVRPFYRDCGAVVVPLLSGGGTRVKILEAGLAGRPVLTTPLGAYGLGLVDGRDAMFFSNRESLLSQYAKLFQKNFYQSLVNHLRDVVISKYSQARFNDAMQRVIASLQIN